MFEGSENAEKQMSEKAEKLYSKRAERLKGWKKAERWEVKGRKSLKWLQTCCSRSRDKVENVPIRNEWENASQTPAIFKKTVIVIAKTLEEVKMVKKG